MKLSAVQPYCGTSVNCNVRGLRVPSCGTGMKRSHEEKRRRLFGEWLRHHREALGLSQTEAGKAAGMSRTQWTRLERGESGTRRENIELIARAVKADANEAYNRAGFSSPIEVPDDPEGDGAKILQYWRELPPEGRDTAIDIIEALWKGYLVKGNVSEDTGARTARKKRSA